MTGAVRAFEAVAVRAAEGADAGRLPARDPGGGASTGTVSLAGATPARRAVAVRAAVRARDAATARRTFPRTLWAAGRGTWGWRRAGAGYIAMGEMGFHLRLGDLDRLAVVAERFLFLFPLGESSFRRSLTEQRGKGSGSHDGDDAAARRKGEAAGKFIEVGLVHGRLGSQISGPVRIAGLVTESDLG
jgi:hypothetical protein